MNEQEVLKLYNALIGNGYLKNDIGDKEIFLSKMVDQQNRADLYKYVSDRGDFRIGDYETYEKRLSSETPTNTPQPKRKVAIEPYNGPQAPRTPLEIIPSAVQLHQMNEREQRENGYVTHKTQELTERARQEEARKNAPIVDTGSEETNTYAIKTQGQLENELSKDAAVLGSKYVKPLVSDALKKADDNWYASIVKSSSVPMGDGGEMFALQHANKEIDPDKVLQDLQETLEKTYSDPQLQAEIERRATDAGVDKDDYIETIIKPAFTSQLESQFADSQMAKYMPKNTVEYVLQGLSNSIVGMLMGAATETKSQRYYKNMAEGATEEGNNSYYNPGTAASLAKMGVSFAADAPFFGIYGKVSGQVVKKIAEREIKKMMAKGLSEGASRSIVGSALENSLGTRMKNYLMQHVISSSLTMGAYDTTSELARQTRDKEGYDLGQVAASAGEGLAIGAAFGLTGGTAQALSQPLSGISKVGAKIAGFGAEAETMYATEELAKMAHGKDGFENPFEGSVEALMKLGVMKVSGGHLLGKGADKLVRAKEVGIKQAAAETAAGILGRNRTGVEFTKNEENYVRSEGQDLINTLTNMHPEIAISEVNGKKKLTAEGEQMRQQLSESYNNFMNNTEVPAIVKQKVARVLGGIYRPGLETGADIIHNADGSVILKTRDKNGNCVRDIKFDSFSEANQFREDCMDEFALNDAVNTWNGMPLEKQADAIRVVAEKYGLSFSKAKDMTISALSINNKSLDPETYRDIFKIVNEEAYPADEANTKHNYQEGKKLTPEERHFALVDAQVAEERLRLFGDDFAEEVMGAADTPDDKLVELASRNDVTGRQLQAAISYYNTSSKVNGMLEQTMRDVEDQVEAANAFVRRNTHTESGSIIIANAHDGNRYYVTAGSIQIAPDGTVDPKASGDIVILRNVDTGEIKVRTPKDLLIESIDDPNRLITENESMEGLRGQLTRQADDQIELHPDTPTEAINGDIYTGADGNQYMAMLLPDEQGNEILAKIALDADGNPVGAPMEFDRDEYRKAKSNEIDAANRPHQEESLLRESAPETEQANISKTDTNVDQTIPNTRQPQKQGVIDSAGGESGRTETSRNEPPASTPSRIPVDEKGNKLYEQAAPEDALAELTEKYGEEGANKFVARMAENTANALERLQNKDTSGIVDANELEAHNDEVADLQKKADFWNGLIKPKDEIADNTVFQIGKTKYSISDEIDENGIPFVLAKDGNVSFGEIGTETGLTKAPILLSEGVITNPETKDGYGLKHIEARHGDQIRNAGYESVIDFIEEVAKNYETIREGRDRDGNKTYLLQLTDKHNNTLIVELSGDGTYWNVNTAGIFKTSYGANRTVVYNRHTTDNQPAETDGASLSGEQSGTTPSTSMNAPTKTVDVSAGKDNKKTDTLQGNQQKSASQQPSGPAKPIEPQQPVVNPKKAKIYQRTVENNIGRTFTFTHGNGVQSSMKIERIDHDGNAVVTRQDYDAQGNAIGAPREERYFFAKVGESIINGNWKKELTIDEQLQKSYKYKVGNVPLLDVLTDEEKMQVFDAVRRGNKEEIGNLTGDLMDKHKEDIILRGREIRNEKVEKAFARSGKGERLRVIREQYGSFPDAVTMLDNESMEPKSIEEYVAEALGDVPKMGSGPLAYYSYEMGDNTVVGLKDETGYGSRSFGGDTKAFNPWLAPKGKGMSLKQFAERIHENLPEGMQAQYSDQDIRNVINSILTSAEKPSDIANYILRNRLAQAETEAQRQEEMWMQEPNFQKVAKERSFAPRLQRAKESVNTEPTEKQKTAGNYKKGHISFGGYDFTIENPAGSIRRGKDASGKQWEQKMRNTYGYILGKKGVDGDHLDMFINDNADLDSWNGTVYVVDQVDPKTGKFDEHKIMYGFSSEAEARKAYLDNYEKGWKGMKAITGVSKEAFDKWLDSSDRKLKEFADHSIPKKHMVDRMRTFDSALRGLDKREISIDDPVLLEEYGLKNVVLSRFGDHLTLTHFVVAEQGRGNGTRFMEDLARLADEKGWTLALTPDTSFGATSVRRLKDFYKRFGFKDNKGRNADFYTRERMVRKPKDYLPSPEKQEETLRKAVIEHLRSKGVEVSEDWREGQRILDEYNSRHNATEGTEGTDRYIKAQKIKNEKELEELNNGPTVKRYRAMQLIDGKLYPPMSAKVEGELREPTEIGVWERSEERPDLIDPKTGKFKLEKGQEGKSNVPAAYNPYFHTSTSGLNDQFTSAYKRPELVVVEVEIPESELTSSYKAQYAKDAVGDTPWHSGPVNGKLPKDRKRTVTLSRYSKVVRIVPDSEVADMIAKQMKGTRIKIPYNVVTKSLRAELEKRGVKIDNKPSGTVTEDVNGNALKKGAKFFKTPDGDAYGYTYLGKIFVDPRIATSETPIHEYGHLWCEMKRQTAPEEWKEMKDVILNDRLVQPIINKVKTDYPELTKEGKEDDFIEEVITQFSGARGTERLREIAEEVARESGGVFGKAEAVTAMQRLKNILNHFWEGVAKMMGWDYRNANQIADRIMADMLNGVNPREQVLNTSRRARQMKAEKQPVFFSNAMRAVEGIKQEKATSEQWLAMIQKNGGLKAGEDKWMGLSEFLNQHQSKSLTKQEVMDFIRQNQIKIEEQHYTENMPEESLKKLDGFNKEFKDIIDKLEAEKNKVYQEMELFNQEMGEKYGYGWNDKLDKEDRKRLAGITKRYDVFDSDVEDLAFSEMIEKYGDDFDMAFEFNYYDRSLEPRRNYDDELTEAALHYLEANDVKPINSTRLTYTTEGLKNKKEIALVVPTIEPYKADDNIHFGDAWEGRAIAWARFGETTTGMTGAQGARNILDDMERRIGTTTDYSKMSDEDAAKRAFANYLWRGDADIDWMRNSEIPSDVGADRAENVVRLFDELVAKSKDNQKVLVIDEIQSKRHQEGREQGYGVLAFKNATIGEYKATDEPTEFIADIIAPNGNKIGTMTRYEYKGEPVTYAALNNDNTHMTSGRSTEQEALDAMDAHTPNGVPAAPFEKNWHELAMKRMLRYAAENGYDKIAWTTGDQQADRYNIGDVINSIDVYPYPDTKDRQVIFHQPNGDTIDLSVDSNGIIEVGQFGGHRLEDVVGKSLAEEIYNATEKKTIEGEDLRIGADGMKGFYDQMLPSFMNKYGKKWGVQVGEIDLPEIGQKMWSVDVTDEMRESVMQGQPMFQKVSKAKKAEEEHKQKQLEIITKENPMMDSHHTGIRTIEDIKTFKEAFNEGKEEAAKGGWKEYAANPDVTNEILKEAMKTGKITVYSSHPIKNGTFVTLSLMMATDYAGGGKVYLRKVSLDDIAWINTDEGEYAKVEDNETPKFQRVSNANNPDQESDRTLIGLHNINTDQLKRALKNGGLANPSVAVIDVLKQTHDKYGDVTLVLPKRMVAAETGRHKGVFAGDIYSPNYPQVYTRLSSKNQEKLNEWVNEKAGNKGYRMGIYHQFLQNVERGDYSGLEYIFLKEKGVDMSEIDGYVREGVDNFWVDYIKKYSNPASFASDWEKDSEMREAISKHIVGEEIIKAMVGIRKNIIDRRLANGEKHIEIKRDMTNVRVEAYKIAKEMIEETLLNENGDVDFTIVEDAFAKNFRLYQTKGDFDPHETRWNVNKYIRDHKLYEEYNQWAKNLLEQYNPKEELYNGTDNMGRPKYVENSLVNASRIMKKQGLRAGDGFFAASMGGARAQLTPVFKTLGEIRKNKWRLSEEAFEEAREELQGEYSELASLFENSSHYYDGKYYDLIDAMKSGNAYEWAHKNGFNISKEDGQRIDDFAEALRVMPTDYFELKFERPVEISEFAAAVVPENTPDDFIQTLRNSGLDIRTYNNKGTEEQIASSRQQAVIDVSNERDDIRFQMVGRRGAENADKIEGDTRRMDNLKMAEELDQNGYKAQEIKFATGWEKGKDGKWRYETMDAKADVIGAFENEFKNQNQKLRELNKKQNDLQRKYERLRASIPVRLDSRYSEEEKAKYRQMRKAREDAWKEYRKASDEYDKYKEEMKDGGVKVSLVTILGDNHELFNYYPEFKDMPVILSSNMKEGTAGSYDGEVIKLNMNELYRLQQRDLDNESMMGTLIHEIQHAVQEVEGFAKGGSLYTSTTEEGIAAIHAKKILEKQELLRRIDINNHVLSSSEFDDYAELAGKSAKEYRDYLEEENEELAQKYDNLELQIQKILFDKAPSMTDAVDLYRSLAGEVEARNATRRMNLSEKERMTYTLEESEDVRRENQVVIMGDGESASMGDGPETFDERQKRAEKEKGVVRPGLASESVEVLSINKHGYKGTIVEATNQAKQAAKAKYAPDGRPITQHYDNYGKKFDYIISGRAISESLNPKQQGKSDNKGAHLAMAEHLDEIIGKSIEVEEHPDVLKNEKGDRDGSIINPNALMHRFYGVVDIDGERYRVMTLMREDRIPKNKDGMYAYEVQKIEVLNEETSSTLNGEDSTKPERLTYPLAKLLNKVEKSKDSGKFLLEESKKSENKQKKSSIQGLEDYSEEEINDYVRDFVEEQIRLSDADAEIVDIKVIGSRTNGTAKHDSDLDVLVEFKGKEREDDMFNMLAEVDEPLTIKGVKIDINPIKTGKSGTITEFLERNNEYDTDRDKRGVKFQRAGTSESELTPEERQYWNKWNADMKKWKERNAIPDEMSEAPEKPKYQQGEGALEYAHRLVNWNRQRSLWQTAPKLEDYREKRLDKDILEEAREYEQRYPNSQAAKMRRVAAELQQIRHAMSQQKAYDKSTVKAVTDFAHNFMQLGFGDNLSRGEIERLLSNVKNATGASDIKKQVDNILNILMDNHLRNLEQKVVKLSSTKELSKTAQGVEKQGKLELKGQRMIQAFRQAREGRMNADQIRERLYEVAEKMGRNEEAPMWEQEYEGLSIALQYQENVEASRNEWAELDREYKDAVKSYKNSGRSYKAQQQLLESLEQAMQENKIERIGMYADVINRLEGNIAESIQGAKEFIEREKERVRHIQSIANYDLAGKDMGAMREKSKGKPANFFLQPLATFEQMLKQFGGRNAKGEGYLYDYFMRNWMDSIDNAYVGEERAKEELDAKAREVFDRGVKRWSDLYEVARRLPSLDVEVLDGETSKTFTLTQGNLLYIYMADKMNDGRMKLRKMGIDEDQVAKIADFLDPRLVQLADWLQDDYLVQKRTLYNKVHERMFGAPMAAIDHYFPIRILSDARVQEQDVANMSNDDAVLPSTITGNIIKRRKNALPLDILHTDALSLAIEHIEDMEQWAAMAEWNKDINTLLSYSTFRNKVKNMNTIYGSGDALWNSFRDAARMAAGTYRPKAKPGSVDAAISNIAKGVTAAKINFRVYTAMKQLLSAPAFLHDVDLGTFAVNSVNPYGSWKWAMENMPVFRKRWRSRQVGDTRLMDDATDWKLWKTNIVQMATRLGMSPNALVDGVTCAVGARSIYESRYKIYRKIGASEEIARKRALQDAEIGYNLTQQSSEGAFVSAIQKDRTVAANMLSVFRNSSMAYTRQWVDAARNLKHRTQNGYKEDSIRFMTHQIQEQFGLDAERASQVAEAEYNRAGRHEVFKLLNMMFGVTIAWNLGSSLPYLLMGDDNKTKIEMLTDALVRGLVAGPTEGLAAGNLWSELMSRSVANEQFRKSLKDGWGSAFDTAIDQGGDYEINPLPLMADIQNTIKKLGYDKFAAAQDIFNICVQSTVGVNPQTFTDMWNACMDYGAPGWDGQNYSFDEKNYNNAKEIALFIMRLMNAPTSSWKNKYIDELGMDAEDAKKLPYEEMAKRYAHYKHWKDTPMTGWLRDDAARAEKIQKLQLQFDKAVNERMERLTDKELANNLLRSRDVTEKRMYAKIATRRLGLTPGATSKKPDEDHWYQEEYQKRMIYEDVKEDELLASKRKKLDSFLTDTEKSEIKKRLDWITDGRWNTRSGRPNKKSLPSDLMDPGKRQLFENDNDEEVMNNIRKWRREALEILLKVEDKNKDVMTE